MKVANKKIDVLNPEIVNPEAHAAVTETGLAPRANLPSSLVGQRTGDVGETRLQLPLLEIAYGVGKLAERFSQGDLVLDKTYLLAKKNEPLIVTFVSEGVYWKQYLSPDQRAAGQKPQNYATKDEAKAAGEITDWPPWGQQGPKPTVARAGVFQMLIQKPKGLECALFAFPMGGELWAPARCFLDKGAFKAVDGALGQALQFSLRARGGNLVAGRFELKTTVTVDPKQGRTNCLPAVRLIGGNTDAELAEIVSAFQGSGPVGADDSQGDEG